MAGVQVGFRDLREAGVEAGSRQATQAGDPDVEWAGVEAGV